MGACDFRRYGYDDNLCITQTITVNSEYKSAHVHDFADDMTH